MLARCARVAFLALAITVLCTCGVPPDPSREQPQLSAFATQYTGALVQAGITKIVSWSDRPEQPVQVTTRGGPIYFPYPQGMPLARFALTVDANAVTVTSDDYDERNHDAYTETMRRIINESIRWTAGNNERLEQKERVTH
jgi:hypothetical protein